MRIAIFEIILGINELILRNDKRRLWQVCHQIKRGFIIVFTFGKYIPKFIDYQKNESSNIHKS